MRSATNVGAAMKACAMHSLLTNDLVALARDGDSSAFDELARRHHTLLFKTAMRVLKNVEDAEDTVQEVYIRAFTRLNSFRGESLFSTWLVRITINASLMHLRSKRVRPTLSLVELLGDDDDSCSELFRSSAPTPEMICSGNEQVTQLHGAVEQLPRKLRTMLSMRLKYDHSIQELATIDGISEAAVKSRLLRARNAVMETMAAQNQRTQQHRLIA
jgi:RNA polymerase sigma-70 factor (ECF subfamily)